MTTTHRTIRMATDEDADIINAIIADVWGDTFLVIKGEAVYPMRHPAIVAENTGGQLVGALTYRATDDHFQIITLDATIEGLGIATELLMTLKDMARKQGVGRIIAMTTNDNLDALRFYQRRGFELVEFHANTMEAAREIKPSIPRVGRYGIPVRDELLLQLTLES